MTFEEILVQVVELLRREGRVSYRALKRRFNLDAEDVADLKDELIEAKQLAADDGAKCWSGPDGVSHRQPLTRTSGFRARRVQCRAHNCQ
jgi:hypothetical protein